MIYMHFNLGIINRFFNQLHFSNESLIITAIQDIHISHRFNTFVEKYWIFN